MTRHLHSRALEMIVSGKHEWRHRDALMATLGDRLSCFSWRSPLGSTRSIGSGVVYALNIDRLQSPLGSTRSSKPCEPGFEKFRYSSARSVVSMVINRLDEPPLFGMATETCAMHDVLSVKSRREDMDGCRFRDDYITTLMRDGKIGYDVHPPYYLDTMNHDDFYPTVNKPVTMDTSMASYLMRMFSAYPRDVWYIPADDRVFPIMASTGELAKTMESIANRYLGHGKKQQSAFRQALDNIARVTEGKKRKEMEITFAKAFSRTENPIIAREVVTSIARENAKKIPRDASKYAGVLYESRYSKLTKAFIDGVSKPGNPLLGDATATLINEGPRSIPVDIDRCSVADKILLKVIPSSDDGKKNAEKYFEKECKNWRKA